MQGAEESLVAPTPPLLGGRRRWSWRTAAHMSKMDRKQEKTLAPRWTAHAGGLQPCRWKGVEQLQGTRQRTDQNPKCLHGAEGLAKFLLRDLGPS